MKKIIIAVVLTIIFLCFCIMYFKGSKPYYKGYKTTDLRDTLKDEGITLANKNYKENDDQVIIYLFRGKGCPHCEDFLNFLNSISEEYGKYFKLVSFEVWYDKANSKLQNNVASFMNAKSSGVPFIIIGDETFVGYSSSYDEQIKSAIKTLYNTDKSKRYDVFEKIEARENGGEKAFKRSVVWNFTFMILFAGVVIVATDIKVNKANKKILENQEEILKQLDKKGSKK